ncbi:MAG: hypothetical protein KAJ15_04380 [Spirochaetes bacterium]|nr:hypothetical protein [Spirochaetota bacterium]
MSREETIEFGKMLKNGFPNPGVAGSTPARRILVLCSRFNVESCLP